MAADDQPPAKPDKNNMLDEIRRRAEEAELRRIEDEEKGPEALPEEPATAAFPAPFPVPAGGPAAPDPEREQRLLVLRERLLIALDRGRVAKAEEILAELRGLAPDDPDTAGFQSRIAAARAKKQEAPPPPAAPSPPPAAPPRDATPVPKPAPPADREQREAQKRRIAEQLDSADSLYQQEKYEAALKIVDQVLAAVPEHPQATKLREQILKAQQIAEMIRREEARRKEMEAAEAPPPMPAVPAAAQDRDIWGASAAAPPEYGVELPPEEKGPVAPPKPPLVERAVERLSRVKVPVKPLITLGIAAVVLGAVYVVVQQIRTAVSSAKYSLVVFPPTVTAGDSALTVLADGLTEELIADLSKASEVRVIGAVTTAAFRGTVVTPQRLARSVGANFYLQWSVLRVPGGVILQPTLFDTLSTRARWTGRYQPAPAELPGVRRELARQVLAATGVTLSMDEMGMLRRVPTGVPAAHAAALEGRALLRARGPAQLAAAILAFQRATREDANFAEAHSGLGWAYVLAYEADKAAPQSYLAQALTCVQRSVELGARSAETFRVWGMVEQARQKQDKALERFEEAVAVEPSDGEAQRRLVVACLLRGRDDLALRAARRQADDDPANPLAHLAMAGVHQFLGQYVYVAAGEVKASRDALWAAKAAYEQGMRYARDRSVIASGAYADVLVYLEQHDAAVTALTDRLARVRDSYPDWYRLGRIEQSAGMPKAEWQTAFLRSRELVGARLKEAPGDAVALSHLALVHTRLGEFKEALAASKRAQQAAPDDYDVLLNTSRLYTLHRDNASALRFLQKALGRRVSLPDILDMDFYNLRSDEAFLKALGR